MDGVKPSSYQAKARTKALPPIHKTNIMSSLELVAGSLHLTTRMPEYPEPRRLSPSPEGA